MKTQKFNEINLTGSVSLVLFDTNTNKIKNELYFPNLVVLTGKEFIASRMIGTSSSVMSHMGIGLSATEPANADTTLGNELTTGAGYTSYARAALTASVPPASPANVVTYVATFAANNPSAPVGGAVLREVAIFNSLTAGTMLCRSVFPIVTKLPADALTVTWAITIN